jgi:extracellular factor (EF) 3-hydroxypalmitic acid methyl ester biosynthesis protein
MLITNGNPRLTAAPDTVHTRNPLPVATSTPQWDVQKNRTALSLQDNVQALLDHALAQVHNGRALAGYRLLGSPLSALWSEARGCARAEEMTAWCRQHPLHALAQQDPYTHRATTKPRGYAGDAVMMDYIYQGTPPPDTSAIAAEIFGATTRASMGLSVLYRRQLLKSLIDDAVVSVDAARVLSVASGHARELEGSLVQSPHFHGEFVALDQDPLSCQEVQRVHAGGRVQVLNEGVRDLLSPERAAALGRFDLVYSAGLYDYLPDVLARRLTQRLLQSLAPGGRLVIANFVPAGSGRGYMELFMDWTLVLRTEAQLRQLAQAAGAAQVHSFLDPHRNVVYAELLREAAA